MRKNFIKKSLCFILLQTPIIGFSQTIEFNKTTISYNINNNLNSWNIIYFPNHYKNFQTITNKYSFIGIGNGFAENFILTGINQCGLGVATIDNYNLKPFKNINSQNYLAKIQVDDAPEFILGNFCSVTDFENQFKKYYFYQNSNSNHTKFFVISDKTKSILYYKNNFINIESYNLIGTTHAIESNQIESQINFYGVYLFKIKHQKPSAIFLINKIQKSIDVQGKYPLIIKENELKNDNQKIIPLSGI